MSPGEDKNPLIGFRLQELDLPLENKDIVKMQVASNIQPDNVDLKKYSGKWYVIACIPTEFDKCRNYTSEQYTLLKGGKVDIQTSFFQEGSKQLVTTKAVGFPDKSSNNVRWKVQYTWPFKTDYLIEELAPNYEFAAVGHPQKKFLYIMSRHGSLPEETFIQILTECGKKGYDLTKLMKVSQ